MPDLINLGTIDLVFTVGLMAIAVGLSVWEKLGLELNLVLATGRTILQLIVLGSILNFIFAVDNVWAVVGILTIILTITSIVARNRISPSTSLRTSQKIPLLLPLVWVVIFASTSLILLYTNFLIIQPERWYEPRYLIPLGGILIGNAMNAAAVSGERLVKSIEQFATEIETHLSLGATPQQAISQYRKDAIKGVCIPTLNQMMIIGMATIPTFTSGQLLAGISPLAAVSYEILIIFMVAVVNLLTTIFVTKGLCRQFFNDKMQLLR